MDNEQARLKTLTSTELEILRQVVEGKRNAAVALSLNLSPRTVETYRTRIMRKLDIDNLPSLVKLAIRLGLTSLD